MSSFWYIVVPAVLFGIIFYSYNSGGFMAERIQIVIDPLIKFVAQILNFLFGV